MPHSVRLHSGAATRFHLLEAETRNDLGRHVYGAAALALGIVGLFWHDFNEWQQLHSLWGAPYGRVFVLIAATGEIAGGLAIQWRRTTQTGAAVLGVVYLCLAALWIPRIIAGPLIYDHWGNFFEQFSLVSAAVIVYASAASGWVRAARAAQIGRICFGICVLSFMLEQLVYLAGTADLVPKWLPPSQMFWAIVTTIALALAAVAIFSGYLGLLASRLLTTMFLMFGLLVWLPMLLADPNNHTNWGGSAQDLVLTGAAWIVADWFSRKRAAL